MIKELVSIVILSYNRKELLQETLLHITYSSYKKYEIIIVDNASNDGTNKFLKEENYKCIILEKNVGVEGWNAGIAKAKGEFILLLDDDAYPSENAIEKAVIELNRNEYVCIAFNIYDKSTGKQHISNWQIDESKKSRCNAYVFTGCAVMYKAEVLKKSEFQVPKDYFLNLHELPMAFNLYQNGYNILFDKGIVAYHLFNKTNKYNSKTDALIFKNTLLFINNNLPIYLSLFYNIQCVLFYLTRSLRHSWYNSYIEILKQNSFFACKKLKTNINYFLKLRKLHTFNYSILSKLKNL